MMQKMDFHGMALMHIVTQQIVFFQAFEVYIPITKRLVFLHFRWVNAEAPS